jgi:site-specific DNA recombinase
MGKGHSNGAAAAGEAAVCYYRMSTDAQEASVPQQREWARPAVAKAGFELAAEFTDEGIPGSEIERRADLQALIEFFETRRRQKRPARALFVWDTDRLSRASSIRTAAVLDRLMQAGLTYIYTPDEVYDLEEDLDLVLFNLKQDLTKAAYAKAIGKNVLRSRLARARAGLWPGGVVPGGYLRGADGHLAVDPAWAPVIRWTFDRYANTADSLADVCRRLNRDPAAPKPPSGRWCSRYVHRILTNDVYLGTITYGDRVRGKYYRNDGGQVARVKGRSGCAREYRAEPGSAVVCEGAHEALVDKATFDAVAAKLAGNRWTKERHSGRRGEWVLTGMAYCGCCGRRLRGRTYHDARRPGKCYVYRRLVCPGRGEHGEPCGAGEALQDVVLRELAALVKGEFGKPAHVERIGRKIEALLGQQEGETARRREALAAKLAAIEADIATATRRLLILPEDILADARREFEAMKRERESLAAELAGADEARQVSRAEAQRMREALADLGRLEEVIADKPPELVRDLLARIVEKVTLHFEADPAGGRKHPLSHLDVTFRPEVAHLFATGAGRACAATG